MGAKQADRQASTSQASQAAHHARASPRQLIDNISSTNRRRERNIVVSTTTTLLRTSVMSGNEYPRVSEVLYACVNPANAAGFRNPTERGGVGRGRGDPSLTALPSVCIPIGSLRHEHEQGLGLGCKGCSLDASLPLTPPSLTRHRQQGTSFSSQEKLRLQRNAAVARPGARGEVSATLSAEDE